jgi:delta 1-pyrroline-5-carboxylate dehydrogenase
VAHDAVDAVILTGGTETALAMHDRKPAMHLLAETGGKNATIVTALADRDLAIKNILHSAFSHSGQKCSATSLVILEDEVYHDAKFRDTLCDAVESLAVGSAWDLASKVGPLIRPPSGALERGLKELDDLRLTGTQITDAGMEHLAKLQSLKYLRVEDTRISDPGLEKIGKIASLETLDLTLTKITDAGLERLIDLRNLKALNLQQTKVTAAGMEKIQKALPKCKVVGMDSGGNAKKSEAKNQPGNHE